MTFTATRAPFHRPTCIVKQSFSNPCPQLSTSGIEKLRANHTENSVLSLLTTLRCFRSVTLVKTQSEHAMQSADAKHVTKCAFRLMQLHAVNTSDHGLQQQHVEYNPGFTLTLSAPHR